MIEDGESKEEETETVSSSFAIFLWQAFLSVVRKKWLIKSKTEKSDMTLNCESKFAISNQYQTLELIYFNHFFAVQQRNACQRKCTKEKKRATFLLLWKLPLHAYAARRLTADSGKTILSKRRSVIVTAVLTMGLM